MSRSTSPTIPVVDLGAVAPHDPTIGRALTDFGFVILEGHGIAPEHWARAYDAATRAFALPAEVKERYRGPADGSQRGYLPLRTTVGDGRDALDRKECWHVRPAGHRFGNIFPLEVPELGETTLALLRELDSVVARVLTGLDAFLGNPIGTFAAMVRDSDSLFRINHYPDFGAGAEHVRFRAHRDFDLATLLLGADKPGLEIASRDGAWWPVAPSADGIVLNAGDVLAVESGGRIPSTMHRVVTPAEPDGGRISMVYFVSPRREVRLRDDRTAGDFLDERLRDAGYLR